MTLFNKPPGLLASLMALVSALLMSCGGTDLAAGPGTGGTGTRDGFVTGFGSVYINGEKFDNSQVQPTLALSADQTADTAFALGQRVSIEYDRATGLIKTAKLKPLLVGPVESVDAQTGWLQVLGQPVRVAGAQKPYADQPGHITQLVAANGQAATSLLDLGLKQGDWVELHGQWLNNMPNPSGAASATTTGSTTGLLASRLQVLSAARSQALLTGQVDRIQAGVGTVRTSDGRQLEFDAQANGLTAGQTAQVWVSAADLTQWQQVGSKPPRAVGDQAQAGPSVSSTEGMVIMGTPSAWSDTTRQLTLNGQTFELPETLLTSTVLAALNAQPLVAHIQLELSRSNAVSAWRVKRIALASAVPLLAPHDSNKDALVPGDVGQLPSTPAFVFAIPSSNPVMPAQAGTQPQTTLFQPHPSD
jgi:hypothetical protein